MSAEMSIEISAENSVEISTGISVDILADISAEMPAELSAGISIEISAEISAEFSIEMPAEISAEFSDKISADFFQMKFGRSFKVGINVYVYARVVAFFFVYETPRDPLKDHRIRPQRSISHQNTPLLGTRPSGGFFNVFCSLSRCPAQIKNTLFFGRSRNKS